MEMEPAEEERGPSAPSPASHFAISVAEAMNASRRSTMEDAYSILRPGTWNEQVPDTTFLAIYDGHGGRDMVDFIQHAMPFHVAQELDTLDDEDEDAHKLKLLRAFLMADIHARKLNITSSGAAVAVALVQTTPGVPTRFRLLTANVGDSRVVAGVETVDTKGQQQIYTERLTFDHAASEPSEVGDSCIVGNLCYPWRFLSHTFLIFNQMQRIDKTGGFFYKGRVLGVLALARSMGDCCLKDFVLGEPFVREALLDFARVEGTRRAFLILACDGLWDVMTDREATERVIAWTGDPEDVARDLVEEGLRRGTGDNLSVVVAWLHRTD